jgi:hypothetical protein
VLPLRGLRERTLRATYAPLDINEVSGTTVNILVPALLLTATTR